MFLFYWERGPWRPFCFLLMRLERSRPGSLAVVDAVLGCLVVVFFVGVSIRSFLVVTAAERKVREVSVNL